MESLIMALLPFLDGAANAAIVLLILIAWRVDRRLLRTEWRVDSIARDLKRHMGESDDED